MSIMKTKVFLPMLAFIFAIGMAFATVNLEPEPEMLASDYILVGSSWITIPEQNCQEGQFNCQVRYGQNGPVLDVYDEMDDDVPKSSGTELPTVINP